MENLRNSPEEEPKGRKLLIRAKRTANLGELSSLILSFSNFYAKRLAIELGLEGNLNGLDTGLRIMDEGASTQDKKLPKGTEIRVSVPLEHGRQVLEQAVADLHNWMAEKYPNDPGLNPGRAERS